MTIRVPDSIADDPLLVEAYRNAAERSILASLNPKIRFGHFTVCADGVDFGSESTYPGLDWGQSAEALLFLGRVDEVLASWDYVRSFQAPTGQLPLAICPEVAGQTVKPVKGDYTLDVDPRGGVFRHWCPGNPLGALPAITFIQVADAIYQATHNVEWLRAELASINRAAEYQESITTPNGRVTGAGYFIERPTRIESDGVSQCYTVDALHRLVLLNQVAGDDVTSRRWNDLAAKVSTNFQSEFWAGDHFVEYIHPTRGAVAAHGLTDVDWAAIACAMATPQQVELVWPQLRQNQLFYYGGIPTGISTQPDSYEAWEFEYPDRHDLAAMGRVWYLECWARHRMGDRAGIIESARRVAQVGQDHDWYWRERYYPTLDDQPLPAGARKYCEYPANLIRIVNRFL